MALEEEIEDIFTTLGPLNGEVTFEWKIKDFFSLSDKIDYSICSSVFGFSDMCLCLILFPNGSSRDSSSGWLDLYLARKDSGPPKKFQFSYGIKSPNGVEREVNAGELEFGPKEAGRGNPKLCLRSTLKEKKSTLMPRNVLTIKGVLKSIVPNVTKGMDIFFESMHNLLKSGEDTDVTIKVQGKEYLVHRTILTARSTVFKSMLTLDMMEKNSGVVTIVDCDPEVFRDFLEYIYTGSTPISVKNVFDLYMISDKYDMESLTEECLEFMERTLTIATFCDVITLAVKHDEKELLKCATKFFCDNSLLIVKTADWQIFLKECTTVGNELIVKVLSKYEGIS